MDYYYIMRSLLFEGLTREEIDRFFVCADAKVKTFKREERIYPLGATVGTLGLVLSGSVRTESTNVLGETSILSIAMPGKTFAEAYACLPDRPLLLDIVAHEDCEILMMSTKTFKHACGKACPFHRRVSQNLSELLSLRNLELSRRIYITGAKTMRDKVLAYLSLQSTEQGARSFDIPFNREQLARYLAVDRSALSAELSRMRARGEIDFRKNHFTLKV